MKPKYSVIIPVYNAEKTLRRCIDSLITDADANYEIILVNDGSKDSSAAICREYKKSLTNIIFVDKKNGGVSTARNAGLDAAGGEYVLFVDSDDYVATGFFSKLEEALKKTPCDLIQFSYCFDNGREIRDRICSPKYTKSREQAMPLLVNAICRKTINGPVAKLYRRDLIEAQQIRFPVGASVGEDRAFNIKYSMYIRSCAVSDQVLYFINTENQNSLTRGRHKDLKAQFSVTSTFFQAALQAAPIPETEKEQYRRAVNFGDCRSIYHDAKLMHQDKIGWFQRQVRLGRLCNEINRKHMKYPKSRYCTLITLPVRLHLTPVIDVIAWKLVH